MNDIEKYKFKPYDPKFKNLFAVERRKIQRLLPYTSAIEHFGSTSVPGLGGKGIVDIIISVPKSKWKISKKVLAENNYRFSEVGSKEERFFFAKDYKYQGKTRRVHVHLTFDGSFNLDHALRVREILKNDHEVRKNYIKLKREASKLSKGDGKLYRNYKNPFLDALARGKK